MPATVLGNYRFGPGTLRCCLATRGKLLELRQPGVTVSIEMHGRLLEALTAARGRVVVSGYDYDPYSQRLAGLRRLEFNRANDSGQGKAERRRL
jgi:hypothetical protein